MYLVEHTVLETKKSYATTPFVTFSAVMMTLMDLVVQF